MIIPPPTIEARASAHGAARRPGLAALLSLAWPGLGQLYNRQIMRGLLLVFGLPVLAKIGLGYAFLGAYEALGDLRYLVLLLAGLSILLLAAGIWVYATVDAYRVALRHNVFHPPGSIDGI